jgi:hypothetical protein
MLKKSIPLSCKVMGSQLLWDNKTKNIQPFCFGFFHLTKQEEPGTWFCAPVEPRKATQRQAWTKLATLSQFFCFG